ncbi:MAG: glycosyltransferase family 39 protein [Saprospiraceae bacterium]|nr:glycosyltransferase family 39 protein [Saprospiraceae bacterium]
MKYLPNRARHLLPDCVFVALLATLCLFFYHKTITFWPSHIHAWTQGDRYALAIKFADTGLNLFKPRTFNLQTKDGITAVDLPLHDYLVGVLMYLSGSKSPALFRVYALLFSILGCWYLYRMTREASHSHFKGYVAALFVFTCPIITYYQAGFIPSATSFAAVLIAYYFYFKYLRARQASDFYWAIGWLTVAALSRSPFNIYLFAVLLQQGVRWFQDRKIVRTEAIAFGMAYTALVAANLYKWWLARVYGSQFLGKLLPASDWAELRGIIGSLAERWTFQLFGIGHYALLAIATFFLVWQLGKRYVERLTRHILLQSGLVLAGGTLYLILMARQYLDHEYYFIDSLYPGVVLWLVAGLLCVPFERVSSRILFGATAALCLGWGILESKQVQQIKYADSPANWGETTRKNFIGAEQLLDSLGIGRDARLLVMDAHSTNIPLIHLNRMGHTLLATRPEDIEMALRLDFDFIVIQDIFLPSEIISNYPLLLHQLERVGGNGRISIFRYNPQGEGGSLKKILDIHHFLLESMLDFEPGNQSAGWNTSVPTEPEGDNVVGRLKSDIEFGPGFSYSREPFAVRRLLFEAKLLPAKKGEKMFLVATLEGGGKVSFYASHTIFLKTPDQWTPYQAMFEFPTNAPPGQELKCYLWNPGGADIRLDNLKVTLF